jgi:dipeptidyl aminopeptidase/acylaminoacyl peptidase
MTHRSSLVSVFTTVCLTVSGIGELLAQQTPMTVDDVLALEDVGNVTISPNGRWVAYVVTERNFERNVNDSDVWVVRADGGDPVRLTYGEGTDNSPQWAPDGAWLAFRSDRGEETQVYGMYPTGGEAWPVTDWETSVGSFRFSPDGVHIAFTASSKKSEEDEELEKLRGRPMVWDSSYADQWTRLWTAPLENMRAGEAVQRSPDTLHVNNFVWAPDSRALAFSTRPSPVLRTYRHGAVFVQDEPGAPARQVTFMPGGEGVVAWTEELGLIVSGSGKELGTFNGQLWVVPPSGGDPVSLTAGFDETAGYVIATDRALFVQAGYRTGRRLYRIPLRDGRAAGAPEPVTDDRYFYSGFSATDDGAAVAFMAEGPATPPNVHVSSTSSFTPKRLTNVNPQVTQYALGEHRVVRWRSRAGGEEIEGALTLPVGYREGTPVPLLLVIHGGPSGVSSNRFSPRRGAYPIQVFAGMGYAVLQPNYRGSTGYGERFRGLNRGDISGRDWVDIDSGVDEMIKQGIADAERLGIMGWSFGGHHTYWGITQTQRFKAASAGAGANDLVSMYSQTDIPEFYHTYLGPKPWEDFDLYEERSAYRNVERVTTPLLIQVGERDERVPAEQSIQFFEAVRTIGKAPTKLVLYPGQPHGVREPRLVRDLVSRNVEWFSKWIPVGAPVSEEQGR